MKIKSIVLSLLLSMTIAKADGLGSLVPSLENVLGEIYGNISAFDISAEEKEAMKKSGNAPTYGELTPKGMVIVVNYMMERLNAYFGDKLPEKIVFIDVGSGAGKVPMGACIEGPFNKCVGVEYSKERHEIAVNAHKKMTSEWSSLLPEDRELVYINEDALKIDMSKMHAIYVSSLCFEKPFMAKLLEKFEKELPDGAVVITSQAFPTTSKHRMKLIRMFTLPQTWKSDSKARAYQMGLKGAVQVQNDIPATWKETQNG
jgi:predicted nicotinamide N-methyase